jgi:hypothetical protein
MNGMRFGGTRGRTGEAASIKRIREKANEWKKRFLRL